MSEKMEDIIVKKNLGKHNSCQLEVLRVISTVMKY